MDGIRIPIKDAIPIQYLPALRILLALLFAASAFNPPAVCAQVSNPGETQWIRPAVPGDPLLWGRKDGIVFGIPSEGGLPGPRGLIRVGLFSAKTGKLELLNYIAIEPVALGPGSRFSRIAFSELESSELDANSRGKRLWVDPRTTADGNWYRGDLRTLPSRPTPIERLSVQVDVERFTANSAHVYLVASIDSDHPNELRLGVHQYDDSAALEELTITATMGNYERLRDLWLKDRIVDSRELYDTYSGDAFVEHDNYPLDEMLRTQDGDAIALWTSNEPSPSAIRNRAAAHWKYTLPRLTQYWRVPAHDIEPDLRVRVNGRRLYWASSDPMPGGTAFENFEVRQRYRPGQVFIFGVTSKEPWQFNPPVPHLTPSPSTDARVLERVEKPPPP